MHASSSVASSQGQAQRAQAGQLPNLEQMFNDETITHISFN